MSDTIEVKVEHDGDAVIVSPAGDVDLHRSPAFRERLKKAAEGRPRRLIVNLSDVPYMDSSGVATLVEAMQIARRQSMTLVLCGVQSRVRSILEIARLDQLFRIAEDTAAAKSV
jgi:anti-sigma B factor antagonist